MKVLISPDHRAHAEALRRRVLEGPGKTAPTLRQASAARAANGLATEAPYDDLARQIGEAAHRVTDAQVSRVLAATGSENHFRDHRGCRFGGRVVTLAAGDQSLG
jgi:hypothetical protein